MPSFCYDLQFTPDESLCEKRSLTLVYTIRTQVLGIIPTARYALLHVEGVSRGFRKSAFRVFLLEAMTSLVRFPYVLWSARVATPSGLLRLTCNLNPLVARIV
ncbi:hypothetical protein PENSPDRAFT_421881 [Peniophora sp. CONT]|nr:hypothetical protein PENSPDRAFT_421881 [Peniophora sp. CONT]